MKLSDLRALLENFQRNFKEEFPILWRVKSEPVFIKAIKQVLENAHASSDRDLSENEIINLALIYNYDDGLQTTSNEQAMAEFKAILGFNFIMLIREFSEKNLLAEFSPLLVTQWRHQESIRAGFVHLLARGLCTLENLRFCFAHPNHFAKAVTAIIRLNDFHPSVVTAENINALLSLIAPRGSYAFDNACSRLHQMISPLTPAQATERFALFLEEERTEFLQLVYLILHAADPTLPAYRLPGKAPSTSFASHVFAHQIATSTSINPILAAQVIASFYLLRTLHPEIFQELVMLAITENNRLPINIHEIIKSYPFDHMGDRGDGFLFLRQLLGLNRFHISTDIVLALHEVNPDLLEANIERIQKLSASHGQELLSAIKAIKRSSLRGQQKFKIDELDLLLNQPTNLISAAMRIGALFSRKDPIIQSIFTNLKSLSSLHATAKSIHPSLGPIASNLGLSGELSLLVTANTFEERQARRAFFMAHLEPCLDSSLAMVAASGGRVLASPNISAEATVLRQAQRIPYTLNDSSLTTSFQ